MNDECGREIRKRDGRVTVCVQKAGHKSRCVDAERRERNTQEYSCEYHREYYRANREELLKKKHEYYLTNKAHHNRNTQKWKDINRDYYLARNREYYLTPEGKASKRRGKHQRRARKLNVDSEPYTREDVIERWGMACYLCDSIVPDDWWVEHVIPLDPGTDTLDNVRPSCPKCNMRKGRKMKFLYRVMAAGLIHPLNPEGVKKDVERIRKLLVDSNHEPRIQAT